MDTITAVKESASIAEADSQFLNTLADIGDHRRLSVVQPIYSATGIKLLDTGATVNSRTFERLVGHRLATPLESRVAAEDSLRPGDLVAQARTQVESQPLLKHFASRCRHGERLWGHLGAALLPPSVLFRLTMAQERNRELYEHSLRAAFVALFIGVEAQLPHRDLEMLATAGLMHDFGMFHVDCSRFDQGRPLDTPTRRLLRAHPLTGMLIALREPLLNPAIATAIVQHHERLDGTGYPAALPDGEITRLARILMLVELVLAMIENKAELADLQLSLVLRANHRAFDRGPAGIVLGALPRIDAADVAAAHPESRAALARLFTLADGIKVDAEAGAVAEARRFASERLLRVRRLLAEVGIDSVMDESPQDTLGGDPIAHAELGGLTAEALWHVRQIAFDVAVRWPELVDPAADGRADPVLRDWLREANAPAPQ